MWIVAVSLELLRMIPPVLFPLGINRMHKSFFNYYFPCWPGITIPSEDFVIIEVLNQVSHIKYHLKKIQEWI